MKPTTLIKVLHLPFLLLLLVGAFTFCTLALFNDIYAWFTDQPDIAFALILIPWWYGTLLNRLMLSFLHRLATPSLPRLRGTLLRTHGTFTLAVALGFAGMATWGGSRVPFAVATLLAGFCLCLPLLSATTLGWLGSRWLGWLHVAVILLAAFVTPSWAGWLTVHPGWSGLILALLILALYRGLLSRSHLRERALSPNLNLLAGHDRQREVQRQLDLRQKVPSTPWRRRTVAPTTADCVRAVAFEHLRGRGVSLALGTLATGTVTVLVVATFYTVIAAPGHHWPNLSDILHAGVAFLWVQPGAPGPAYVGGMMVVVIATTAALLLPQSVSPVRFPVSRQRLALTVLRFNSLSVLGWHAVISVVLVAAHFGLRWGNLSGSSLSSLPPVFGGLPLSLAVCWILLTGRVLTLGWTHLLAKLTQLFAIGVLMLLPVIGVIWHETLLKPPTLGLLLAGNAVLWSGYAVALHHHYRTRDLLVHQVGPGLQTV